MEVIQQQPLVVIACRYHISTQAVRGWLTKAEIAVKPRTSRTDWRQLHPVPVRDQYEQRQWSAAQIAADQQTTVGVVLHNFRDHGIPVRRGGPHLGQQRHEPYRLLDDLDADSHVTAFLRRHRISTRPSSDSSPPAPAAGPAHPNGPASELSARHIELTGQPTEQILDALHRQGSQCAPSAETPPPGSAATARRREATGPLSRGRSTTPAMTGPGTKTYPSASRLTAAVSRLAQLSLSRALAQFRYPPRLRLPSG